MIFSPRLVQRLNQRTSCVATEDFFNTIGVKQTPVDRQASLTSVENDPTRKSGNLVFCDAHIEAHVQ
jgi:hypothetical protein